MRKHLAISLVAVMILVFSPRAISRTDSFRRRIHTFEGEIATITNSTIAVIGGRWYKAGEGETTWSNVSDEFMIGYRLWLCCERFLVLKPNFAKPTNHSMGL